MASVLSPPDSSGLFKPDADPMNTLPDPRSSTPVSALSRQTSGSDHSEHPDLSSEVAALSTKLINAINHQTNLDDSLQSARHQLEAARKRVAELEAAEQQHKAKINQGLLLPKEVVDRTEARLRGEASEERQQRVTAEKETKRIEQELENLTSALFEEANTMVAAARRETEASEKRNQQLRNQMKDTEMLLASQQEQLRDLKTVMHDMTSERAESDTNPLSSSVPSTPGIAPSDRLSRLFEAVNLTPVTPGSEEIAPDHPLSFSHLLHPVLRTDTDAYLELRSLLKVSKSAATSRVNSGAFNTGNTLGIGSTNSSTAASTPSTPNFPPNGVNGSPAPQHVLPLKETIFWKRAQSEDIDPTLRLDQAPGVSWLARRTIINSMATGNLVVEPIPPPATRWNYGPVYSCSLCGENRKGDVYRRKHRFRTSEAEDAQRYPLCDYCLGRIRSTCDYIGFLRLCKDGHWRADTEEEVKGAWEECTRLREKMFWARVGGGVIPAFIQAHRDSPRISGLDDRPSGEEQRDPFKSNGKKVKRVSIGKTIIEPIERYDSGDEQGDEKEEGHGIQNEEMEESRSPSEDEAAQQLKSEMHASSKQEEFQQERNGQPNGQTESTRDAGGKKEQRLSLTIPGAFE
ncbi:Sec2p-domain-containing protein [Aulographum hederae CBS 113979]|uniref:Sec2p-domain-containing protein n=1 Tax=Aulographum hederae CBS 113979 TaxID=1176131 RepID=A0A6G1GS80_9PEZI|nr:Sec2p-domain-containing protein [Aulographum hederae CBS 113979]